MTRDDLKVLNDRAATKEDAQAGRVVFHIPDSRSIPYQFDNELPLLAKVTTPDEDNGFPPPGALVAIVQAELGDNGQILFGVMYGHGEEGICQPGEVEVIGPLGEAFPMTDLYGSASEAKENVEPNRMESA